MTIVHEFGNNFWIETFLVPTTTVAANTVLITTHTLERSGTLISISTAMFNNDSSTNGRNIGVAITIGPVVGSIIVDFQSRLINGVSASRNIGANITVLMRGPGH